MKYSKKINVHYDYSNMTYHERNPNEKYLIFLNKKSKCAVTFKIQCKKSTVPIFI